MLGVAGTVAAATHSSVPEIARVIVVAGAA